MQSINITLPDNLAKDLKSIPEKKRSKFVAEAVSEKLSKKSNISKKEWIKSLEANREYYEKVGKEIAEDFKYADAEVLERIP